MVGIRVTTCGNGTCDTACETLTNCPDDCGVCDYDTTCEDDRGETSSNCIDCAWTDTWANGSDLPITVPPDTPFTISWEIHAPDTSDCDVLKNTAVWVADPARPTGSRRDSIPRVQDQCQTDSDCLPCYACEPTPFLGEYVYNAKCAEKDVSKEDPEPVKVRVSYDRLVCRRISGCTP